MHSHLPGDRFQKLGLRGSNLVPEIREQITRLFNDLDQPVSTAFVAG